MVKRYLRLIVPTPVAVAASMLVAAAAYCLMSTLSCFMDGDPGRYPVRFPVSVLGGLFCAGAVVLLVLWYRRLRKRDPSLPMTVADVLLALAAVLPAFLIWSKLAQRIFA